MTAFDPASVKLKVEGLEKKVSEPDFWNDGEAAQFTLKKLSALKASLGEVEELDTRCTDIAELL